MHAARSRTRVLASLWPMSLNVIASAAKQSILSFCCAMDCFVARAPRNDGFGLLESNCSCHRPPTGRRAAPPDDRPRRAIQYSETPVIESRSRGVINPPHARGMTTCCEAAPACKRQNPLPVPLNLIARCRYSQLDRRIDAGAALDASPLALGSNTFISNQ